MAEFMWFWFLLGSIALLLIVIGELGARKPWRFEFMETNSLLIATPWGGFELAHEGFDPCEYRRWTGVKVWRRIPGTMDVELPSLTPVFKSVYAHELRREPKWLGQK